MNVSSESHGNAPEKMRNQRSLGVGLAANPQGERRLAYSVKDATNYSETFDYVMVFPLNKDGSQTDYYKDAMLRMLEAGLEVFSYKSVQEDELYVLIRCPLRLLKDFADQIDYKLKIDEVALCNTLMSGDLERRIAPVKITELPELCPYSPYEHMYFKYGREIDQALYSIAPGEKTCFNKQVRLKLIYLLLRAPKRDFGCDIEISKLLHKKRMLAMFPLHDRKYTDFILERCLEVKTMPWDAPVEEIRDYFGEKIALYNVFLGHYSWWLIIPSFIGLAFQLVVWATLRFSHPVLPFYSLVITVWSVVMLEHWKRREAKTALRWGMSDFEQLEQDRPEFAGEVIKSFINGRDMTYFPPSQSQTRLRLSQTMITLFVAIVIGVVAAIYVFRFYLQGISGTAPYSSLVASVLNTVQITVFNIIYQKLAKMLTDRENHRTDTQYEDSLIVKMFVFQFINSYASFFFLAFIAGNLPRPPDAPSEYLGQCGASNCMEPLSINLAIIFGSRLTITNFLDIFMPYYTYKQKVKKETEGIDPHKELTPAERDYMLMQYDPMLESIQNYADTAVQYGFTMLFITALPCASFFSLVNNYAKVKFNAWKLVTFYQRPIPGGAQDIGTWQSIFNIVSIAAVITNAGLICFTMDVLWDVFDLTRRVWIFIGFQWVLISIQFLTQYFIPDVPEAVEIQLQRREFINLKVIEKVEDEDFGRTAELNSYETNDDDGANEAGCCGRPKVSSRSRKPREGLDEFDVTSYPFSSVPGSWPEPLDKMNLKFKTPEQHTKAAGIDLNSYASNIAAVRNPAAVYH